MRSFSLPLPTVLSGFVAILVGYASSAAIIWQAAIAAGASTGQIAGWMTALGIAMGVSTLALTLWYRAPVLTGMVNARRRVTGYRLAGAHACGGHRRIYCRECVNRSVRRNRVVCPLNAGDSAFSGRRDAGRYFIAFWFAGVRSSGWRAVSVRQYAAGVVAESAGAALCGYRRNGGWRSGCGGVRGCDSRRHNPLPGATGVYRAPLFACS